MRSSCYKDNHFYSFLQHVHVTRYKTFNNFQITQVIPIKIKTSVPNHSILIKPHHCINPYTPILFNGWVVLLQSVILIEIKITGPIYSILKNVNHPLPHYTATPFNGTLPLFQLQGSENPSNNAIKIWGGHYNPSYLTHNNPYYIITAIKITILPPKIKNNRRLYYSSINPTIKRRNISCLSNNL